MSSHVCAFCKQTFTLNNDTYRLRYQNFYNTSPNYDNYPGSILISFYKCPNENCNQTSLHISGENVFLNHIDKWIHPDSDAIQFPDYVPITIRNDYEEACKIVELSPKASATLSRRALQGMIRDFWNETKQNLHQEILAIQDKVDPDEFDALMSMKSIGNIGAHPDRDISTIIDVDVNEARQLIGLIELFIEDWYIKSHEKKLRLRKIIEIASDKTSQSNHE